MIFRLSSNTKVLLRNFTNPVYTTYIGFGSNIGDRQSFIKQALHFLSDTNGIKINKISSLYETEPVGNVEQGKFLNGVVSIETHHSPQTLLNILKTIEFNVGRQHRMHWGPREIDMDLLIYGDLCLHTPELIIPHPEMHLRRFVLVPLAEIASNLIHPVLKKSIQFLLNHLEDAYSLEIFIDDDFVSDL